jgi:predicted phage tail protein
MLRKIKLYGPLAEFVGRSSVTADVSCIAEAVRMLLVNFPKLETHIRQHSYQVFCGETSFAENELHFPVGNDDIKIVPVVTGAGGGSGFGVAQIIGGVALIALSAVSFGSAAFAGAFAAKVGIFGAATATGSIALLAAGAGLVLSGVSTLLSPIPQLPSFSGSTTGKRSADDPRDPRNSFSFSGIQNVARAGVPVPIVYGKTLVGSIVISSGVDVVNKKITPSVPPGSLRGEVIVFDAGGTEL